MEKTIFNPETAVEVNLSLSDFVIVRENGALIKKCKNWKKGV